MTEPTHPVWGEPFDGPALQALPTSRVTALELAVLLVGLAAHGSVSVGRPHDLTEQRLATLGGNVLALAAEFETYLTGTA